MFLAFRFGLFLRFLLSLFAWLGGVPVRCFVVYRTCFFPGRAGSLYMCSIELARPGGGRNRRTPMILRCEQLPVLAGGMFVFGLRCERRSVRFASVGFLLRSRPRFDAAGAVEGHVRVVHD